MKIEVRITKSFKRQAKKLLKKYDSLSKELYGLQEELRKNPFLGTKISRNSFKIRIKVKSKGKGKSGGLRTITYIEKEIIAITEGTENEQIIVNLISIYDKSKTANISNKEINDLIKNKEY